MRGGVNLNMKDYELVLDSIKKDISKYKKILNKVATRKISEDDKIIIKQVDCVLGELRSLEKYVKCASGDLGDFKL